MMRSTQSLSVQLRHSLRSFDLNVRIRCAPGFTVLFGPSGSGKSTMLDLIAGIKRPLWGRIALGTRVILDTDQGIDMPPQDRGVGYVFQRSGLFPHLSVRDNIIFGMHKLRPRERSARAAELAALFRLNDLLDSKPQQLSGGQAQRVALARALGAQPRVLLLDEPFAALDQAMREALGQELRSIQEEMHIPVVLVTHSVAEAALLADTVVRIQGGSIVTTGTPADVLSTAAGTACGATSCFSW